MGENNKLSDAKIYKLTHPGTDQVYVGSTCLKYLSLRKALHKSNYKAFCRGFGNESSSYGLYRFGDDVKIELLEKLTDCKDKKTMYMKEQEYINRYGPNALNKNKPINV